ncbi:type III-B CRISPR module RAMP protein Cmr6 [Rhodocaloribacter sp.]
MRRRPLYKGHAGDRLSFTEKGHAGLWYTRFFDGFGKDWKTEDVSKPRWVRSATGPVGSEAGLRSVRRRRDQLAQALKAEQQIFRLDGPFVTGLGLPHPVENGFLWHPTLGTPYLPASTIKGMLRAWMEVWARDEVTKEQVNDWFGTASDKDASGTAGSLIFFDALPIEPVTLTADVMTPHMGKWYEQGLKIKDPGRETEKIPADWHDPVPVTFLVVKEAKFQFMIAARNEQARAVLPEILRHLEKALGIMGIGAKTAVGYGRFTPAEASDAKPEPKAIDPEAKKRVDERYDIASTYPEPVREWVRLALKTGGWDEMMRRANEWLSTLESLTPLDERSITFFWDWMEKNKPDIMTNPDKKKRNNKPAFKSNQIAIAKRLIALRQRLEDRG